MIYGRRYLLWGAAWLGTIVLGCSAAARVVEISSGHHFQTEPIRLGPADSNTHFVGRGAEVSVFDFGRRITFTAVSNNLWEADAPHGCDFDQLWVNGVRATRARTPDVGYAYLADLDAEEPCRDFFIEPPLATTLAGLSPEALARVRFQVWQNWDTGFIAPAAVAGETGHVTGRTKLLTPLFKSLSRGRPRFVVENFRAALNAPGEWFRDEVRKRILYIPRSGEVVETAEAYVPSVDCALIIEGATNVVFRDIGFEHIGWRLGSGGVQNFQGVYRTTNAAIVVTKAADVRLENVRVAHTGAHGVWFADGAERGALVHALIEDVGACGVRIGPSLSGALRRPTAAEIARDIVVTDSIVRVGGREEEGACGILLTHAADCSITHNAIYDFYYTGISLGWTWGFAPTFVRRNLVAWNDLHHLNQGHLADMAGIYTLGDSTGTRIVCNYIHDIAGYRPAFWTWALYSDEGSRGVLVASNIVERCPEAAIHQNYGQGNVYAGNLLLGFDRHGIRRSRYEEGISVTFRDNVFVWDNPAVPLFDANGATKKGDVVFTGNVAVCRGGIVTNLPPGVAQASAGYVIQPPFDRSRAGVLDADIAWRRRSEMVTWSAAEVIAPPPCCSRRVSFDFERIPVGSFAPRTGSSPYVLYATATSTNALRVIEEGGNRFLRVMERPCEKIDWEPHLFSTFAFRGGFVSVRFRIRLSAAGKMRMTGRDYGGRPSPWAFDQGFSAVLTAAETGVDTWSYATLSVDLVNRRWWLSVAPENAPNVVREVAAGTFRDIGFRDFTWLGFLSEGKVGASCDLDDIILEQCQHLNERERK